MKQLIQTEFKSKNELIDYFVNLFQEDEDFQTFLREMGVYHSYELWDIVDEDLKRNGLESRYIGTTEDFVKYDITLFYETDINIKLFKEEDYQFYLNRYAEFLKVWEKTEQEIDLLEKLTLAN
ncbi:hypothetical protein [Mycoplasma sp. 4404]|uniref:hypothetical protein n=1 Tax=Mycoplasma sp. 4404 TaxID=3108530 RepID=UPI002B1D3AB7|nr:hypothetical protein [Mycoplasma sp. 4404]MEA4162626.1 hypothetical protein [Mycoplasma sp. 4404]